jgi:ComF family protein
LHALKYRYVERAATIFARMFEKERLNLARINADCVVPIPLHKRRLRERGFNQAELIAAPVAGYIKKPLEIGVLSRRASRPQVKVQKRSARKKNARGLFTIQNDEPIFARNVLLVDDVTTTGATLEEAAKVLLSSGARSVGALVLAKD